MFVKYGREYVELCRRVGLNDEGDSIFIEGYAQHTWRTRAKYMKQNHMFTPRPFQGGLREIRSTPKTAG
jgi:hypothetical protein